MSCLLYRSHQRMICHVTTVSTCVFYNQRIIFFFCFYCYLTCSNLDTNMSSADMDVIICYYANTFCCSSSLPPIKTHVESFLIMVIQRTKLDKASNVCINYPLSAISIFMKALGQYVNFRYYLTVVD